MNMVTEFFYIRPDVWLPPAAPAPRPPPQGAAPAPRPPTQGRSDEAVPASSDSDVEIVAVQLGGEPDEFVQEVAQSICTQHALVVRPTLQMSEIAGDGNCFTRAVAVATPQGEDSHMQLRGSAMEEVSSNDAFYQCFLPGGTVAQWCRKMRHRRSHIKHPLVSSGDRQATEQ